MELVYAWILGWVAGLLFGVASVALFNHFSQTRSLHRTRLATFVVLLSRLNVADARRLFSKGLLPHWVVFPKCEQLLWLNHEVVKVWPFLQKAACIPLMTWMESTLDLYKEDSFASFKFEKFMLGAAAPQFSGIEKIKSKLDEITLEFDFQWIGNPIVVLVVQTLAGASLPVQIKNVHFAARIRLTFKPLADEFPCFKAFTYSIRELRAFDLNLKADPEVVYSHPGFLKQVETFIETTMEDSLVWPMRQIFKVVPGDYRELEVQVSGILRVKVVEAKNLLNMDVIGKSDPFAILYIRHIPSRMKKTKIVNNDLNPVWNETFKFEVEDLPTQSLFIKVLDDDGVQEAELLGCAKFELKKLKPGQFIDLWIPLLKNFDAYRTSSNKYRGEIHLELCYICSNKDVLNPLFSSKVSSVSSVSRRLTSLERIFSNKEMTASPTIKKLMSPRNLMESTVIRGVLSLTVLRADELMVKEHKKALDSYVLLKMKKSHAVMQTKVIHKSYEPEWNETFHIVIEDALHEMLILEVWNHRIFSEKLIGKRALTVMCLLRNNDDDMEVELQENNAGKVFLHLKWRDLAASDPQFL